MTGNEASETDSAIPQETPMKSRGRKKRTQSDAEVSTSSKLPPRIAPAEGEETNGKRERKRKIQFDAEVSTGNTKALDTTDDIMQVTQTSKDEITSDQKNNKKQKIEENIEELKHDRSESDAVETASLIGKQVGKDFNGTFCI
jgi:transcription initiation factor IIF auxiliary subunit